MATSDPFKETREGVEKTKALYNRAQLSISRGDFTEANKHLNEAVETHRKTNALFSALQDVTGSLGAHMKANEEHIAHLGTIRENAKTAAIAKYSALREKLKGAAPKEGQAEIAKTDADLIAIQKNLNAAHEASLGHLLPKEKAAATLPPPFIDPEVQHARDLAISTLYPLAQADHQLTQALAALEDGQTTTAINSLWRASAHVKEHVRADNEAKKIKEKEKREREQRLLLGEAASADDAVNRLLISVNSARDGGRAAFQEAVHKVAGLVREKKLSDAFRTLREAHRWRGKMEQALKDIYLNVTHYSPRTMSSSAHMLFSEVYHPELHKTLLQLRQEIAGPRLGRLKERKLKREMAGLVLKDDEETEAALRAAKERAALERRQREGK